MHRRSSSFSIVRYQSEMKMHLLNFISPVLLSVFGCFARCLLSVAFPKAWRWFVWSCAPYSWMCVLEWFADYILKTYECRKRFTIARISQLIELKECLRVHCMPGLNTAKRRTSMGKLQIYGENENENENERISKSGNGTQTLLM